jgi:CRISPR-associated protein Cmr3
MTVWIIEPRDPLIVRDGRPFGPDPGARATPLPFPFPSTVAGGLRGLAGRAEGQQFRAELSEIVREHVHVCGPLLVELNCDGSIADWYAPAPADATIHELETRDEKRGALLRLLPLALPSGACTNLPNTLLPVGQSGAPDKRKPHSQTPQFWRWNAFAQWLSAPEESTVEVATRGIRTLETNPRMHVSIVPETQTAREGFLYQTRGLEFATKHDSATKQHKRLALAAQVEVTGKEDELFAHFGGGMAPLGGERRLMRWEQHESLKLRAAPEGLFAQIGEQRACRIVLLTPAYFTAGYKPDVSKLADKLSAELVAAAVPRAQVVSGWDIVAGTPKPTRRLAPAGSVYFVRFDKNDDTQQIAEWSAKLWMTCIGDDTQSCRDGFGLVALGVWDGQTQQIGA